jgi:hypothetical protein
MLYIEWLEKVNVRLPEELKYNSDDTEAYRIYLQTQPYTNSSSDTKDYPEVFHTFSGGRVIQYNKVTLHPTLRCCLYSTLLNHATTPSYTFFTSYQINKLKNQ